jgi:hypothetical protein
MMALQDAFLTSPLPPSPPPPLPPFLLLLNHHHQPLSHPTFNPHFIDPSAFRSKAVIGRTSSGMSNKQMRPVVKSEAWELLLRGGSGGAGRMRAHMLGRVRRNCLGYKIAAAQRVCGSCCERSFALRHTSCSALSAFASGGESSRFKMRFFFSAASRSNFRQLSAFVLFDAAAAFHNSFFGALF